MSPPSPSLAASAYALSLPKLPNSDPPLLPFDLKAFIHPESGPRKLLSSSHDEIIKKDSPQPQVETHLGGTRWNPTQEQIRFRRTAEPSNVYCQFTYWFK